MSDYDINHIRRLDGSLLLVFRELLRHRQATRAAQRLGLTPSAVSHALARLRDLFDDPLFIRRPHGLEPTHVALELGPRIEALIDLAGATLDRRSGFDPAGSERRFNLGAPEFVTATIGARLVETFRTQAPRASYRSQFMLLDSAQEALRTGQIDLALGAFGPLRPGLVAEPLYEDAYCVVARRGHPKIDGPLDLAAYADIGHVYVHSLATESGSGRLAGDPLYGSIPSPRLVRTWAVASTFPEAMLMVSTSDAVADCPRRLARRYADRLDLQMLELPVSTPPLQVSVVRRAGDRDPGVDWFLDAIRAAVA